MVILVTCKNKEEKDTIKNIGARVVTRLFINFSDAQGQLTQYSAMGFYEILTYSSFYDCPCFL